jgi:stearoyl-CoA desaturase (delta-9 desaturase)
MQLEGHRVTAPDVDAVCRGRVRYAPLKSLWFLGMLGAALVGGALTFSWSAVALFAFITAAVLLLGHSLGNHRKLVHDSFQCPKWLEYALVYCGVQVGLAGPIGLLRQHELRDYAQRLPRCHDYLRHGRGPLLDAWWQLNCELELERPPVVRIEPRIAHDRFYRFLERTWMAQQLPLAALLFVCGGWAFVFWGSARHRVLAAAPPGRHDVAARGDELSRQHALQLVCAARGCAVRRQLRRNRPALLRTARRGAGAQWERLRAG